MKDKVGLKLRREHPFFSGWDEFVSPEQIVASEASLRRLIDDLLNLSPELTEEKARHAVDECVGRFNVLDDGWICTIEREDIYEEISQIVDLCGFDCNEDWMSEREF